MTTWNKIKWVLAGVAVAALTVLVMVLRNRRREADEARAMAARDMLEFIPPPEPPPLEVFVDEFKEATERYRKSLQDMKKDEVVAKFDRVFGRHKDEDTTP